MFQKDAIVRLLRDNDPVTVSLLKEQLIESGSDGIAALRSDLELFWTQALEGFKTIVEQSDPKG